jgi:hypothetical protein
MKYCYACGHTTGGNPLFCNSCGCSYNVKLCPKLHVNPRIAEACSRCGSRDLSTPQPRVPVSWRLLAVLAQAVSGLFLVYLSVSLLAAFLEDWTRRTATPDRLIVGLFVFIVLWGSWALLPDGCQWIIHRSLMRKSGSLQDRNRW